MRGVTKVGSLVIVLCGFGTSARSQNIALSDNADPRFSWFDQRIGIANLPLLNGPEYYIPFKGFSSHPFYGESAPAAGWVEYDGDLYAGVQLLYDIFSDELVLKYLRQDGLISMIQLDKARVSAFEVRGHHFEHRNVTNASARLSPGFYDILFKGDRFEFAVKRVKETKLESVDVVNFDQADRFYLVQNDQWSPISGLGSFNRLLVSKERQQKLKSFVRSNHIKLRKKNDEDLRKIGSYCQTLIQ